jgi:uncharacterized protein YjbJ (UPF0337 family)
MGAGNMERGLRQPAGACAAGPASNCRFADNRWVIRPTDQKRAPRTIVLQCDVSAVRRRILRSQFMSMNKDQVEGRAKEAAGKVREVAGKVVGNTNQQVKGNINKNVGAAQAKFGDVKRDIKDSK